MKYAKIIVPIVVLMMALVAVLGFVGYQVVFAQAPTPTTPTTPSQNGKAWGGMHGGYSEADLAAALGITTNQLTAAYTTAWAEALKEAVAKGLITQSQADQLAQRSPMFGRMNEGYLQANGIDFNALLAKALNISTDQLNAAYAKAYTTAINNAVKNGQMTQAQADKLLGEYALKNDSTFQSAMKSAFTAAVNAAVKSGVITQAQADQILNAQNTQTQNGGGFFPFGGFGGGFGPGHGRHGGFGPRNKFNHGNNNGANPQTQPTATPNGSGL